MGQYYHLVILNDHKKTYPNKKKVNSWLYSHEFDNGSKLMEFSYIDNHFVGTFEELINKEHGKFAGYPVICAGDYADDEPYKLNGEKMNIYSLCDDYGKEIKKDDAPKPKHYRYIINETKGLFFDTDRVKEDKDGYKIHPLPLLIADGNGRGGGDYEGKNERMIGSWKRNVVVTSDNRPDEAKYREVFYNFRETYY